MTWASSHGYAVFTPSVLQVRCLNVLAEAIGSLVLNLLGSYSDELEQGALIVADERRQQVRILPLEPRNSINT